MMTLSGTLFWITPSSQIVHDRLTENLMIPKVASPEARGLFLRVDLNQLKLLSDGL